MLFSKAHPHRLDQQMSKIHIKIGAEKIRFNEEATRWLSVWLDSQLKFNAHVNEKLQKARTAEIQIKRLTRTYGLAPALLRLIQIAVIQFIAFYGAELWWRGQKNHEDTI